MDNGVDAQVGEQDQSLLNGFSTDLPILPGMPSDSATMIPSLGNATPMSTLPMQSISADEIALYDRQIRLWGVQAQELIRNANLLLIGMKALGNEIAKNLVLAGIGSLTILDHESVTEEDLGSQFLISERQVGRNRADAAAAELRKMNPRVNVFADKQSVMTKMPQYFAMFQIVIATGQGFEAASTINMSCRMCNVKFYAADTHGIYGYIFSDLIMHQFNMERDQGNVPTKPGLTESSTRMVIGVENKTENNKVKEIVTKQEIYCPLMLANSSPLPPEALKSRRTKMRVPPLISCLRGLFEFQKQTQRQQVLTQDLPLYTKLTSEKHAELQLPSETLSANYLRMFLQNLGTEIPPTAAFLGGQLAQDVINVLSLREQPLQNFLFFDGDDFKSPIYSLQPVFDPNLPLDPVAFDLPQDTVVNGDLPVTNGIFPANDHLELNSSTQA